MKHWILSLIARIPDFPGLRRTPAEDILIDLKHPNPSKKRPFGLFSFVFALVFTVSGLAALYVFLPGSRQEPQVLMKPAEPEIIAEEQPPPVLPSDYMVLVIGKEKDGRADTLILCHFLLEQRAIRVLSLPRDTRVLTAHNGTQVMDKVSHAYRWGGLELLTHSIMEFLRVPIHHYAVIDLAIFRKIIDTIGGVEVEIEKDLKYTDKAQNLRIDLSKGVHLLKGEDAEGYVRYRSDGLGDLGRIERQKKFLQALINRLKSLKTVSWDSIKVLGRLPGFLTELIQDVQTSMPMELILRIAQTFSEISREAVAFKTLQGAGEYIAVPEYRKKINFYMCSEDDVKLSRDWLLNGLEVDTSAYSQAEFFNRFRPMQNSSPAMETITSAEAVQVETHATTGQ